MPRLTADRTRHVPFWNVQAHPSSDTTALTRFAGMIGEVVTALLCALITAAAPPLCCAQQAFAVVLTGVFLVFAIAILRRNGITLESVRRSAATTAKGTLNAAVIAVAATSSRPKCM